MMADVYDALTSQRPYKSTLSYEDAAKEILSQKGSQFDPSVVTTFSAISPEGLQLILNATKMAMYLKIILLADTPEF